ncbi:MAG: hypothetical protein JWO67_3825 [Streptosporangiaceae bacterium]|nr:hypothetical protein [Streptosporangiaceae bacterium]
MGLEPQHALDTFCSCPYCQCLGHHDILERGPRQPTVLQGYGGAQIDASGFGEPPAGTYTVTRRCFSCGRRWRRHDPDPEMES